MTYLSSPLSQLVPKPDDLDTRPVTGVSDFVGHFNHQRLEGRRALSLYRNLATHHLRQVDPSRAGASRTHAPHNAGSATPRLLTGGFVLRLQKAGKSGAIRRYDRPPSSPRRRGDHEVMGSARSTLPPHGDEKLRMHLCDVEVVVNDGERGDHVLDEAPPPGTRRSA